MARALHIHNFCFQKKIRRGHLVKYDLSGVDAAIGCPLLEGQQRVCYLNNLVSVNGEEKGYCFGTDYMDCPIYGILVCEEELS
jgi:hypothetical protein